MPLRIIARLDIKAPNLVKGMRLEGLRVLGDPRILPRAISSRARTNFTTRTSWPASTDAIAFSISLATAAEQIFVPLTVGGGLRRWTTSARHCGPGRTRFA